MSLSFIKCGIEDLDKLQEISKSTFTHTFESQNDPEEFEAYIDYSFSKQKLTFEMLNPNSEFFFVFKDKELIAYFKLNYNDAQTEHFHQLAAELERFYVRHPFQRQGIGQVMMEYVIAKIKGRKSPFIWLGVWQKNERAIKFYEQQGFEKFDTHPYFIGRERQTDWLMKLKTT